MVLGVDPGFGGGLALLSAEGALVDAWPMPLRGARRKHEGYDLTGVVRLARELLDRAQRDDPDMVLRVWMEAPQHVRVRGRLDAHATASLFECAGMWRGAFGELGVFVELVAPTTWQAAMLKGAAGGDTKAKAAHVASLYWPERRLSEGEADGALVAEYGRRIEDQRAAAGQGANCGA